MSSTNKTNMKNTKFLFSRVHRKVKENWIKKFLFAHSRVNKPKLYGKITLKQATYLFLYHIITYDGYHSLEQLFDFPHSNMRQVFGSIRRALFRHTMTLLSTGTLSERRKSARKYVKDDEFIKSTLVVDSADFRLQKRDNKGHRSKHYSRKEKSFAARYQFLVSHDKMIRHVGGPFSPKKHDSACMKRMRKILVQRFCKGDIILGDLHYTPLVTRWKILRVVCKHRKPRKPRKLTPLQQGYNRAHCAARNKVEHVIADLKSRFKALNSPYRRSRQSHAQIIVIASAVHNDIYAKYRVNKKN